MKRLLLIVFTLIVVTNISNAEDKLSITGWGGLTIPTGFLDDLYDAGIGFAGNIEYRIVPSIGITASIGYYRWSATEEISNGIEETFESSLTTIPLLGGLKYYLLPGSTSPYASLEAGIHFVSWEETFIGETGSDSGSDIGFGAGGGVLIFLNPDFQIDANIKYNSINTETDPLTFISALIGIRIVL